MKLRNKKTGEFKEFNEMFLTQTVRETDLITSEHVASKYHSLAELNEEWEDYKPVEPLIKDEKIRKAVRAWADFNGDYPIYCEDRCTLSCEHAPRIEFKDRVFANLDDRAYTIAELCGEEEE